MQTVDTAGAIEALREGKIVTAPDLHFRRRGLRRKLKAETETKHVVAVERIVDGLDFDLGNRYTVTYDDGRLRTALEKSTFWVEG